MECLTGAQRVIVISCLRAYFTSRKAAVRKTERCCSLPASCSLRRNICRFTLRILKHGVPTDKQADLDRGQNACRRRSVPPQPQRNELAAPKKPVRHCCRRYLSETMVSPSLRVLGVVVGSHARYPAPTWHGRQLHLIPRGGLYFRSAACS